MAVLRDAEAAPHQECEQGDERERADKPELFADDREDEISVRLGQEEELLPAVADPQSPDATSADGDERLERLETLAQGIGLGADECEEPVAPIRGPECQRSTGGRAVGGTRGPPPRRSAPPQKQPPHPAHLLPPSPA